MKLTDWHGCIGTYGGDALGAEVPPTSFEYEDDAAAASSSSRSKPSTAPCERDEAGGDPISPVAVQRNRQLRRSSERARSPRSAPANPHRSGNGEATASRRWFRRRRRRGEACLIRQNDHDTRAARSSAGRRRQRSRT